MLLRTLTRPPLVSRQLPRRLPSFARAMSVSHLENAAQLDGILNKSNTKLSVSVAACRPPNNPYNDALLLRSLTSMRLGAYSNPLHLLQCLSGAKVWSLPYDCTDIRGFGEAIPECQFPKVRRRPGEGCRYSVSRHGHVSMLIFFTRKHQVHALSAFQAHLRFLERNCGGRQNPRRKQTVS